MAIVGSAAERPDSPKVEGGINARSYTRTFLVTTNDKNTGPLAVINAPGIPLLYSAYVFGSEFDSYALLRHIEAERIAPGSLQWDVVCKYETPEPQSEKDAKEGGTKREAPGSNENPMLCFPEIDITFERFQEVVYWVYNFSTQAIEPFKASNGQVFDPPPQRDSSRMVVQIVRNEDITTPHPALGITYMDAVNSDTWFGLPAGTWKVQSIAAKRQTKQVNAGGIPTVLPYLSVTYKLEARPTWDLRILDAGTFYLEDRGGAGKAKVAFISDDGHPRTGPLDGFGGKLADGATPVFLTSRPYQRLPFSALNLPQSFLQFA